MNQGIKLSILVDNQVRGNLCQEHGFAVWISMGDQRILLDTGAGGALFPNARQLDVDLAQATALVLSHGHYDHSGGIAEFLALNTRAKVFMAAGVELERYSCHPDKPVRYIGMCQPEVDALAALPVERQRVLNAPRLLDNRIGLTGPIPRQTGFEDVGGPFYRDPWQLEADAIADDQALWIETLGGLVIVVGCCHAGLVNTVEYIRSVTGERRVRGIVGGLHLLQAGPARMAQTLQALQAWAPDFVIPCHCTGEAAVTQLRAELGADKVLPGYAGMNFSLNGKSLQPDF